MFDERFRGVFPSLAATPVRLLARAGVSPNQVSVAACVVGCGAAVLVALKYPLAGIVVWFFSRILDGIDGTLARLTSTKSAFGGYLDMTLDMIAYAAMLFGFWIIHPEAGWAWPAILAGYLLVTTSTLALSSILEQSRAELSGNRTIRFTPGLAEAGETTLAYVLFAALPSQVTPLAWTWAAMCAITVVQRSVLAHRLLRGD
jgi:phosphatidylglycerophosphate synthase